MGEPKTYTLSQVAQHRFKNDCWLVINGRVLNVTKFLEEHPGGEEALIEVAGKDATKEFDDIGHSKAAHNMLLNYQIGLLPGFKVDQAQAQAQAQAQDADGYKAQDMKAFVIKDDDAINNKSETFLEFFLPILVAGSYFCYTYLG